MWVVAGCACLLAAVPLACSAASRHKGLTALFDGVPPLEDPATAGATAAVTADARPIPKPLNQEHGPYAAKLCDACHLRAATNALVAPGEQLCFRCHELGMDKKYVHGPLASGGCLVCHDPHRSQYRYLLVSDNTGFCFHCHETSALEQGTAHENVEEKCTICHDAHKSDKKYLLN
jgi:predicted CXXCH cytochrome family protein